ncbi:MAG: hypothetical protein ACYTFA_10545 [Planctomycetota bacterium]
MRSLTNDLLWVRVLGKRLGGAYVVLGEVAECPDKLPGHAQFIPSVTPAEMA